MDEAHTASREPQAKDVPFLKDEIAWASKAKTSWFFPSARSGETAQGSISSTHTK